MCRDESTNTVTDHESSQHTDSTEGYYLFLRPTVKFPIFLTYNTVTDHTTHSHRVRRSHTNHDIGYMIDVPCQWATPLIG